MGTVDSGELCGQGGGWSTEPSLFRCRQQGEDITPVSSGCLVWSINVLNDSSVCQEQRGTSEATTHHRYSGGRWCEVSPPVNDRNVLDYRGEQSAPRLWSINSNWRYGLCVRLAGQLCWLCRDSQYWPSVTLCDRLLASTLTLQVPGSH